MTKIRLKKMNDGYTYKTLDGRFTIERKHGIPATWWLIHDELGKLPRTFTSADTLTEARETIYEQLEEEELGYFD